MCTFTSANGMKTLVDYKEIVPKVTLKYAAKTRSGTGFGEVKEVLNGEYGYRLATGQRLECIRYSGSNAEMYVFPKVLRIHEGGLTISEFYTNDEIFIPFKKSLPSAGIFEERDMCIEPCGWLYYGYEKMDDILNSNPDWDEIWYRHGGWSTNSGKWDNLKNFVKMGQLSFA